MHRFFLILLLSASYVYSGSQTREVLISTNLGDMKFMLYDDTPKHRDAFLELAKSGYFSGTLFFRVLTDLLIQGGSASTKNAPPGTKIGFGDPGKQIDHEILPQYFHKKGALCAPRQPDEKNPLRRSDISQFYIVKGRIHSSGELDTMEMAVNNPIRASIANRYMTPEIRAKLKELRDAKKVAEFREIADKIKAQIDTEYSLQSGILKFSPVRRDAYTTVGGYPDLDGKYTVFGECYEGFEVIDKIASLKTDSNDRPFTDVRIQVRILK